MTIEILNKPQGWVPNPEGVEQILDDPTNNVHRMTPAMRAEFERFRMRSIGEKKTFLLTDALLKLMPEWKRYAQGIGDCVSWGTEAAGTITLANDIIHEGLAIDWPGPMATEPLYGLMRVEAIGKKSGGWQDGAYGAAAAKAVSNYGYLARIDYSKETGNPEHDLTRYDGKRAKSWGNYGCGGEKDGGKLDAVAKRFPCKDLVQVKSFKEAVLLIESGYCIFVCSNVGFDGSRNRDGFKETRGTWYHCMCFFGVKYNEYGEPVGVANMQSWGNSEGLENAAEFGTHPEIAKCSWWIRPSTVDNMLRQGDSYAISGINGFKPRNIDWTQGWNVAA